MSGDNPFNQDQFGHGSFTDDSFGSEANPLVAGATGPEQPVEKKRGCSTTTIVLLIVLVLLLGCCGLCGGFAGLGVFMLKKSPPYTMALAKVQNDPAVIERLGEPIEPASFLPTGEFSDAGDSGSANLNFKVKGPKGTALVNVVARKIGGQWGITTLTVVIDSPSERLQLDVSDMGGPEEAPQWNPGAAVAPEATQENDEPPPEPEEAPSANISLPEGIEIPE
ncbi:hypothetical protein JCM19992_06720 [Thermostilla marina]